MIKWEDHFIAYPDGLRTKKFSKLIKPLPWLDNYSDNLLLTMELLYRDGRDDIMRLRDEKIIIPVRDGWHSIETDPGVYMHLCYPRELINWRGKYESLYSQIQDMSETVYLYTLHKKAQETLWTMYKCVGFDGTHVSPDRNPDGTSKDWDDLIEKEQQTFLFLEPSGGYYSWPLHWNYQCSRCCAPMPKGIKAWIKLQHSKLKDAQ